MKLHDAFLEQSDHCAALGSPFMAQWCRVMATGIDETASVTKALSQSQGDVGPKGHSLPLRLAGGLHALVLQGADEALASVYPPNTATDAELLTQVNRALHAHVDFLLDWIKLPPQTNEVRRSAALILCAMWATGRFGLPIALSELGASGGLNLNFDKFALRVGDQTFGPTDPLFTLTPDWDGPAPIGAWPIITDRRGVDLNPLSPHDPADALRLLAYLWPDQSDRITRTRAAIAGHEGTVDKMDAIDWLEGRLSQPKTGQCHMIYSTIAWQYFPADAKTRGTKMIEAAGAKATKDAPIVWFQMENDGRTDGAAMTARVWPTGDLIDFGRIDFHGRWLRR